MTGTAASEKDLDPARVNVPPTPHWLRLGDRRIGTRLAICFALIVLSMMAADVIAGWQFSRTTASAQVLAEADRISLSVIRVRLDVDTFREDLAAVADNHNTRQFTADAAALKTKFIEDVNQSRNLIESSAYTQQDPMIRGDIENLRTTLPSQIDAAVALASAGNWSALDVQVSNETQALAHESSLVVEKVEDAVAQQRAEAIESGRMARRQLIAILPVAVLTLLIAVALGVYATRSITDPLSELEAGARALAKGDFEYRVRYRGDDEVAEVGRVLNDTAQQLASLYQTLRGNEARLRLTIDTIPAFVWSTLPDGSVDFNNRRWLEFSGFSREQAQGSDWAEAVHPEDRAPFMEAWRAAIASGEAMELEVRLRRTDGQYRWLLIRQVPLRDETGKVVKWYGTSADIDDLKRAEQERERLHQLEADLAHINRVNMMGELSASIAHEVNQPLTGVVSNGSACLRFLDVDPPDLEEIRETVRDIVRDGKRAGDIITRIRALTKRTAPPIEKLDLNETIQGVLPLVADEAKKNNVTMRMEFADEVCPVLGDRVQLQQVALNLVMNAIQAMSDVNDRTRQLVITTRHVAEDQLEVTVEDSGVGLDPDKITRIFEPFYTTKSGGMGMGLSICRSILHNHAGRLWATRNEGPGTSFHFTLPEYRGGDWLE